MSSQGICTKFWQGPQLLHRVPQAFQNLNRYSSLFLENWLMPLSRESWGFIWFILGSRGKIRAIQMRGKWANNLKSKFRWSICRKPTECCLAGGISTSLREKLPEFKRHHRKSAFCQQPAISCDGNFGICLSWIKLSAALSSQQNTQGCDSLSIFCIKLVASPIFCRISSKSGIKLLFWDLFDKSVLYTVCSFSMLMTAAARLNLSLSSIHHCKY